MKMWQGIFYLAVRHECVTAGRKQCAAFGKFFGTVNQCESGIKYIADCAIALYAPEQLTLPVWAKHQSHVNRIINT